jgi:hypothetical protein
MSNKPRLKDRLKANRRAERGVTLYLRGDLYAEIEELDLQLVQANTHPDDRLNSGRDRQRIAQRIEELRAQMDESAITFRLRALPPGRWTELQAAHPPRKGNALDTKLDVNVDAFNLAVVRESIIEPEVDDEDWAALIDPESGIAGAQFDELSGTAWTLNTTAVSVPFSRAASRILQPSEPA